MAFSSGGGNMIDDVVLGDDGTEYVTRDSNGLEAGLDSTSEKRS